MAKRAVKKGSKALLFDRLALNGDTASSEQQPLRYFAIEDVKQSIAKELSNLLNTRRAGSNFSPDIATTTLSYGIGDYAGRSFKNSQDLSYIAKDIKNAIIKFEPRLSSVEVEIPEDQRINGEPTVIIEGSLKLENIDHQFSFEVGLHSETFGDG